MTTPREVNSTTCTSLNRVAGILAILAVAIPHSLAQVPRPLNPQDSQAAVDRAQYQEKLEQIAIDKAAYAGAIVARWEDAAKASGRWDPNFANDVQAALMKLTPDNLLKAGEASTFEEMMNVLATGKTSRTVLPNALGDVADDLVYTPVPPCRIADTRNAGGAIAAGTTRNFDVDGSTFLSQGGFNGSCGIPFGVAQAVAMTLHAIQPSQLGYFKAWRYLSPQPTASVLNFAAGQNIANTTIVPVFPGGGPDFSLSSSVTSHAVVDVVGYYAAPVATALDCTTASSALIAVPVNSWTAADASCPAGRTATGGGWYSNEGTLGYPGVWTVSLPGAAYGFNGWRIWVDNQTNGARHVQAWTLCCRIPGR